MAVPTVRIDSGSPEMVDYTPGSAKIPGDVVVENDRIGIVMHDIAANALGALAVHGGVFKFPKAVTTSDAISAGELCYWDAGSSIATTTAGSNKKIGHCAEDVAATTTPVLIHLGSRS